MMKKIKIVKLKNFFQKLPEVLAEHAFLTFLALTVLALVVTAFSFYQYRAMSQEPKYQIGKKVVKLNQENYQEVLEKWQKRQEKFEQASQKQFLDPFQEIRASVVSEKEQETQREEEQEAQKEEGGQEVESTPESISESQQIPEGISKQEQSPFSAELSERLLRTITLFEFYIIKDGIFPSIDQRAKIWEEKGLGPAEEYQGFSWQNQRLLEQLKKEIRY